MKKRFRGRGLEMGTKTTLIEVGEFNVFGIPDNNLDLVQ